MVKDVSDLDTNECKGLILALAGMYPDKFFIDNFRLGKLQNSSSYFLGARTHFAVSPLIRTISFPGKKGDIVGVKRDEEKSENEERKYLLDTLTEMLKRIDPKGSLQGENLLEKVYDACTMRSIEHLKKDRNEKIMDATLSREPDNLKKSQDARDSFDDVVKQKGAYEEFVKRNFGISNRANGEMQALYWTTGMIMMFNHYKNFKTFDEMREFLETGWEKLNDRLFKESYPQDSGKSFGLDEFDKDDLKERVKLLTMAVCSANLQVALDNEPNFDNSIMMEYITAKRQKNKAPKSTRMVFLNREGQKSQIKKDKYKLYKKLVPQFYERGMLNNILFKLFGKEKDSQNSKITDKLLADKERRIYIDAMMNVASVAEKFRELIFEGMSVGSENLNFGKHDKILLASTLMNLYAIDGVQTMVPQIDKKIEQMHSSIGVEEAYEYLPDCFDTIFNVLTKHPKLAYKFLKDNYDSYMNENVVSSGSMPIIFMISSDDDEDYDEEDDEYGDDEYGEDEDDDEFDM